MKKQGLIHLHELLLKTAVHLQSTGELPEEALEDYRQSNIRPTSLHKGKAEHKRAVLELGDLLSCWAETQLDDVNVEEEELDSEVSQWMVEKP